MKKKYINSIIITSLFLLFSGLYAKDYVSFHSEEKLKQISQEQIKNDISAFSLEKIKDIENIEIHKTPDKNLIKTISEKIKNAKKRIYIEAYIFTEKDFLSALTKAKKNGVDIKIIMEKNVYKAGNINKKAYDEFTKNKIDVIWSDSSDYSLNHSKFFIIDDEIIISTGNLTYSAFTKNREFFLFISDKNILEKMLTNFNLDFAKDKKYVYDDNLVFSPFYSRQKIEYLLTKAESEIDMYFPYFEDDRLQNMLEDKIDSGINVKIVTDKQNENVKEFEDLGIKIKVLPKYTEHAKVIVIDQKIAYVGSINFSKYSFDENKETGILIKNENIVKNLLANFQEDFK
ncbi:MAG: phospholipase D-like domain-containing protein [Candidatus Gracilibacteria bacterium]|nr:phospholipase D-like domain-containing protein [Candidatus Gracilibacteria bacterium]